MLFFLTSWYKISFGEFRSKSDRLYLGLMCSLLTTALSNQRIFGFLLVRFSSLWDVHNYGAICFSFRALCYFIRFMTKRKQTRQRERLGERTEQFASSCTEGVSSEELSLNLNNRFHRVDGCRDSLMRSSQVDSEMSLPLGKSSNWENIYRDRIGNERFAGKWPQLALRSQFHFNDVVFVTLAIFF